MVVAFFAPSLIGLHCDDTFAKIVGQGVCVLVRIIVPAPRNFLGSNGDSNCTKRKHDA
jgi:hypothetical protein